jgi:alkyl sulfatase BDS1-like metallo-beta-lactamase superfamily hydrolase
MKRLTIHAVLTCMVTIWFTSAPAADMRKDATAATKAANDALLEYLPFGDKQSFEDSHKGLLPLCHRA